MKRLREEVDSSDPELAAAGRLLAQIGPLPQSEVRARRVRRALERRGSRGGRGRWVVVFALLGLAGSAAAAFGVTEWLFEGKIEHGPSEVDSGGPAEPKRDVGARRSDAEPSDLSKNASVGEVPSEKESAERLSAEPSGIETNWAERPRVSDHKPSAKSAAPAGRRVVVAPTLSEARLVQDAVQALRSGDDPEKAERLLSEYRKNSSSGHLDEEALALTIEVALAKKSPDAARHARLYLQKYPGGKFTPLAKRALSSK